MIDQRTPAGHYNPLYDAQGNVIALVNSSGKVERTFSYGPYGENTKSEGTQTIPYPFGYKGGYRVPGGNKGEGNVSNGLYHFGERYYDPTTGRWTQPDPLDQTGDITQGNSFVFAGADPINAADLRGTLIDFLLEKAADTLHAGEHFIFSKKLAREAKVGRLFKLVGKAFKVFSIASFANNCANKLTGGGLEGHDPGSCDLVQLVIP